MSIHESLSLESEGTGDEVVGGKGSFGSEEPDRARISLPDFVSSAMTALTANPMAKARPPEHPILSNKKSRALPIRKQSYIT